MSLSSTNSNIHRSLDELMLANQAKSPTRAFFNSPPTSAKLKELIEATLSPRSPEALSQAGSQELPSLLFRSHDEDDQRLLEYAAANKIGGLDGTHIPSVKDIRQARFELSKLAANRNPEISIPSLKSLQALITNDPLTLDSSADLIDILKTLVEQMDRSVQEGRNNAVRKEFVKTLSALSELIILHSAKDHLGSITEEFKLRIDQTMTGLGALNSKKDLHLTFEIKYAHEGIKRFKDDSEIVKDIIRRLFHLSMALASYFYDGISLVDEIKKAFCDTHMKVRLKQSWFEDIFLMRLLAKEILSDIIPKDSNGEEMSEKKIYAYKQSLLQALLLHMADNGADKKPEWPFYYGAYEILTDIVLHSNYPHIRRIAFEGCSIFDPKSNAKKPKILKGLLHGADFNEYPSKRRSVSATTAKYRTVDYNAEIRFIMAEHLLNIIAKSPDPSIIEAAKKLLISRSVCETAQRITNFLTMRLPSVDHQEAWISGTHKLVGPGEKTASSDNKGPQKTHIVEKQLSSDKIQRVPPKIESKLSDRNLNQEKSRQRHSLPTKIKSFSLPSLDNLDSTHENNESKLTSEESEEQIPMIFEMEPQEKRSRSLSRNNTTTLYNIEEESKMYLVRGQHSLLDNRLNEAKRDLKLAYNLDNTCLKAALELAKLYAKSGDDEKAEKWAKRVLAIEKGHSKAKKLIDDLEKRRKNASKQG